MRLFAAIILIAILFSSCANHKTQPFNAEYNPMIKSVDSDLPFIVKNINSQFDDVLYYKLAKDYQKNQRENFAKLQAVVRNKIHGRKNKNFDALKIQALRRIENEIRLIQEANSKISKAAPISLCDRPDEEALKTSGYEFYSPKINKMNYIFEIAHKKFSDLSQSSDRLFEEILSKNFLKTLFEPTETELGLFHESDNRMNLSITANSIFLLSALYDLDKNEYNKIIKSIPTIVFFYKLNADYFDKNSMLFFEKQFPLIHNGYSFGGSGMFSNGKVGVNFAKEPHDCIEAISYIMAKDVGVEEKMACGSYFSTYDFLNLYRIKKIKATDVGYEFLINRSQYYYLNRYFDILDISDIGLEGLKKGDILLWRVGVKNILSKTLGESGHTVVYLGNDGDRIYGLQHGRQIEDFGFSGYGIAVYSYKKLTNSDKIFTMVIRKKQNIKSIKEVDEYYDKLNKCK